MHWRANGHAYGIGREIRDWLEADSTVVVSGSRGHLPQALADFPRMQVVLITASPEVLRSRLASRGREDAKAIEARLARGIALDMPPGAAAHEIVNNGEISGAGDQLLEILA